MDIVTVSGTLRFPEWFSSLKDAGTIGIAADAGRPTLSDISMNRDAVLLSLPTAAGLPSAAVFLAAAGAIAAALATAGALAVALGNLLAEDVVYGLSWTPVPPTARLVTSRLALTAVTVLGGIIAISAPTDPLRLMLWSLALTASTAFPILILSIWWKRLNAFGAIAGLATGFAVTILAIVAGESEWIGLEGPLAAALGMPAAAVAAIVVTIMTPAPSRHALELVRDIRIPGGEILYDREMRFQRRQKNQRGAA
jgi:cation/acetate symporter